ncbi:MAG: hypothetical protein HOC23_14700 [Halieaceae bacterium]|nr:hypothetical protein [Halieaceae bacterium]
MVNTSIFMPKENSSNLRPDRLNNTLLALASFSITVALVCAIAWYRSVTEPVTLDDIDYTQREILAQQLIQISPGTHEWAWFEPRIGYTLKRNAELTMWNDTFVSNELGYRTGQEKKTAGVFRVLFVGDSWTFGMGVTQEESYPKVFERLANNHSSDSDRNADRKIEAWTLSLPGYNTFNYINALKFFFHRLEPDAVVFAPSSNDNHSATNVLPNGSTSRAGVMQDQFGDPHSVVYNAHTITSFRYNKRWEIAYEQIKEVESRLEELKIPSVIFWLARWSENHVHYWTDNSGLSSPYLVVPSQYTLGKWRNPLPIGHGNPEAHELYGYMVYTLLAHRLGLEALPSPLSTSDIEWPQVFTQPPDNKKLVASYKQYAHSQTRKQIAESFEPNDNDRNLQLQSPGRLDIRTGIMGRATTILIRRREAVDRLSITVARLPGAPFIYPMEISVGIPSAADVTSTLFTIPRDGDETSIFELEIPSDIPVGAAMDVIFEAENVSSFPNRLSTRSIYIKKIEQVESSNGSALEKGTQSETRPING